MFFNSWAWPKSLQRGNLGLGLNEMAAEAWGGQNLGVNSILGGVFGGLTAQELGGVDTTQPAPMEMQLTMLWGSQPPPPPGLPLSISRACPPGVLRIWGLHASHRDRPAPFLGWGKPQHAANFDCLESSNSDLTLARLGRVQGTGETAKREMGSGWKTYQVNLWGFRRGASSSKRPCS